MSEFKTRLLGFSALAMAFAGLSYGQANIACSAGTASANPTVRIEGETELVGSPSVNCTNSGASTTGAVYVTSSATITSRAASANVGATTFAPANSDVVLGVSTDGGTTWSGIYAGAVNGTQVSFANVTLPATAFTAQVFNLRVNANAVSNPQITASVLISYAQGSQTANVAVSDEKIAYALPSLKTTLAVNGSNQAVYYGGTTSNFTTCAGEPLSSSTVPTAAFTLNIQELFAGAFKTQAQENGNYLTSSAATLSPNTGAATQATQIQVAFANIPSAATVYLPISVTSGNTILTLQGSLTALNSPASLVNLASSGVYGFTATSGIVTATYVVSQNTGTGTTFSMPVFIQVAKNAAPVQATAMTVLVSYTPTGAVTGPQGTIPNFAVSTTTPTNTLTVTPCNTTLLFPYVTNKSGFETGIAIANTTTDNLKSDGTNSATATNGTCVLNFYGDTATQPKAFTTPTIGAFDATSGATPVYANVLTTMAGGATEFSGYVIASCNFLDAHGYAFLVDGTLGQPNGVAQGYLALVTANGRSGAEATPGLSN